MKFVSIAWALGLCCIGARPASAWEVVSTNPSAGFFSLQFIGKDTGYVTGTGGFLKTTNGGDQWTGHSTVWIPRTAHFINGRQGWAVSDSGVLYRTVTAGQSWDSLFRFSAVASSVTFVDSSRGWIVQDPAADSLRILATIDGGLTWSRVVTQKKPIATEHAFFGYVQNARTLFRSGDTGWVVAAYYLYYRFSSSSIPRMDTGYGALLKTMDGGQTWSESALDGPWSAGHHAGTDTWYLQGYPENKLTGTAGGPLGCGHGCTYYYSLESNNRIKHLLNGDTTGEQVVIQAGDSQYLQAIHFRGKDTGIAVGTHGLIVRTSDGGLTWVTESTSGMGSLSDVKIVSGSRAFAVDGRLLRTDPSQPFTVVAVRPAPDIQKTLQLSQSTLRYRLPYATSVSVRVADLQGKMLWQDQSVQAPGNHSLTLPVASLPPGNYFVEFQAGGLRESLRFTRAR